MMAWGLVSAIGAEGDRQSTDKAAIGKAVESYVAAFNQGNAKALAALWAPEAVYTNPLSGEQVVGREAIEKQFSAIFSQAKGAKLEAKTDSIRFISPNVAVEQGAAKVIRAEQPQQAEDIAASAPEVAPEKGEWMSLGVFALTPDGQAAGPEPTLILQLAINKQGTISGTLNN